MTLSLGMETHSSLMEFHIITNRTTPVPFLGILGSIFRLKILLETERTLIWGCTVCLRPSKYHVQLPYL